jgi:hypothetical protein
MRKPSGSTVGQKRRRRVPEPATPSAGFGTRSVPDLRIEERELEAGGLN